jgi:hypothetical protein
MALLALRSSPGALYGYEEHAVYRARVPWTRRVC